MFKLLFLIKFPFNIDIQCSFDLSPLLLTDWLEERWMESHEYRFDLSKD